MKPRSVFRFVIVFCLLAGHPRGVPCPRCGVDPTDPFWWWKRVRVRLGLLALICTIVTMATLLAPPWMVWWPWWLTGLTGLAAAFCFALTAWANRQARRWRSGRRG